MPKSPFQCPVCFEVNKKSSTISLPCGSSCCFDCLTQWCVSNIKELQLQFEDTLPCIISSCKNSLKIEQIHPKLPTHHQEKINHSLFSVYLNKAQDIRRCPNNNCSYAGIISTTFSCTKPLECAECGTNWKDQSTLRNPFHEIFSYLWKKMKAKKCPNCSVAIQKNGGCNNMICQRCKYEFCWICSASAPRHNQFYHFFHRTITIWVHRILISLIFSFFFLRWLDHWQPNSYLVKEKLDCLKFEWSFTNFKWISLGWLAYIVLRACLHLVSRLFGPYRMKRIQVNRRLMSRRNIVLTFLSLVIILCSR